MGWVGGRLGRLGGLGGWLGREGGIEHVVDVFVVVVRGYVLGGAREYCGLGFRGFLGCEVEDLGLVW